MGTNYDLLKKIVHCLFSACFTYECILQREFPVDIAGLSARVACFTVMIMGFVVMASYAADMTSMLTTSTPRRTINSFAEALDQGYRFIVTPNSSDQQTLKSAKPGSAMHTAYYEHVLKDPGFSFIWDVDEAIEVIKTVEKTVYFTHNIVFQGATDLITVDTMQDRAIGYLAVGLQKDSEFKSLFDYHLLRLMQNSVLDKEIRKYLKEDRPDASSKLSMSEAEALGPESVIFLTGLLCCGLAASVVLGVIEKIANIKFRY